MKNHSIVIPSANEIALLFKNENVAFLEKGLDLRFIKTNLKFLKNGTFKNKEEALGLTDRECIWAEFADTYEQYDKDILSNKAYGTLQSTVIENNRYCWLYTYKWPKYNSSGNVISVSSFGYEVNYNTINALYLLTKKNAFGLKKYSIDKPVNDNLTTREKEVLFYLCHNKSAKRIALLLNISFRTVESHIDNIKLKLKCNNKDQIVEYAVNNHYVSILPGRLLEIPSVEEGIKTGLHQFLSGLLD